jgi:uncharacterized protein
MVKIDPISTDGDSFTHAIGTYEEGLRWIGVPSARATGGYPISDVRIAQYCALVEDANPAFRSGELAESLWGAIVAPAASLQTWVKQPPWTADGEAAVKPMLLRVPLPGRSLINVSTDIEYHRPMFAGDVLSVSDHVAEISEVKTTRLGTGHFVTTIARYENQKGEPVATSTNIQFRFDPSEGVS